MRALLQLSREQEMIKRAIKLPYLLNVFEKQFAQKVMRLIKGH